MRLLFLCMALLTVLACSDDSGNDFSMGPECGVNATTDRFGYLTCTSTGSMTPPFGQPEVIQCASHCPGVTPACVTKCLEAHVPAGPQWNCPCDGSPCWREISSDLKFCPGCGDGDIEAPEECEGDDFGGVTCASLGCAGGNLICSNTCLIDSSACFGCP